MLQRAPECPSACISSTVVLTVCDVDRFMQEKFSALRPGTLGLSYTNSMKTFDTMNMFIRAHVWSRFILQSCSTAPPRVALAGQGVKT